MIYEPEIRPPTRSFWITWRANLSVALMCVMPQVDLQVPQYQLSVKTNKWNDDDQINFSHASARRLPAETLLDASMR